ncbi:MAG: hypothetical protein GPOALKHO_000441 [Sodalis sp.]|nr:MAG: hypothetical protein GPOALKHO_000441 [Sodalis sp.]
MSHLPTKSAPCWMGILGDSYFPAIDVFGGLSRIMPLIVSEVYLSLAAVLRHFYRFIDLPQGGVTGAGRRVPA